jgi:hypothetical protein
VVHGGIGAAQQHIAAGAVFREQADADGGRYRDRHMLQREHRLHGLQQLVGHQGGLVGVVDVGEYDDKLVPTQARNDVGTAHAAREAVRHLAQQLVTGMVAQRVVHGLEMVQVDEQHGQVAVGLLGLRDLAFELLHQVAAVGQLGECVVQREEGLALLHLLACADVAGHHDAVVAVQLRHGLAHHLHRNVVPVLVRDGHFVGMLGAAAGVFQRNGSVFRVNEAEDGQAQDFVQRVAGQARQRLVAVDDDAVSMEDDGLVRRFGELAHALFALAHHAFGAPAFGDVVDQHKGAHRIRLASKCGIRLTSIMRISPLGSVCSRVYLTRSPRMQRSTWGRMASQARLPMACSTVSPRMDCVECPLYAA